MSNKSISLAGLALATFAFLITFGWGETAPDKLSLSEALASAATVYILVFIVLKIFAKLIDLIRD